MPRFTSSFMAAALAATFAVSSVVPLNAAPIVAPAPSAPGNIINVQGVDMMREQYGSRYRQLGQERYWRGEPQVRRAIRRAGPDFRRPAPRVGPDFRRAGPAYRPGWYNGYRGYRDRRAGWRYYDGWWFPPAAFVAGAIIGGALSADRGYYGNNWDAHVAWCYNRYRSYREWDNTYQPYNGPRRQCYSPYS